jgi:short-subunit dehydrogenase
VRRRRDLRAELTPHRAALVTGASSGLGAGLARRLALRGTRVYAAARRRDRLEALAAEIGPGPGAIVPVVLDVADTAAVVDAVRRLDEESGGLDLIVANAGLGTTRHASKLTWERDVEPVLRTNVLGACATLTAALPGMVARGRGHLVGVSSLAAARGLPTSAAYSASKAALTIFLEGLRVDLARTGVRVTAIHPGFVRTEMTAQNRFPMPFLMELEPALDAILEGIDRGRRDVSFPWPLAAATRLSRFVPDAAFDRLAGRMGPRR